MFSLLNVFSALEGYMYLRTNLTSLQLVLCRVAAVKCHTVNHH